MSKKIPGITIVFSLRSSSKKVWCVDQLEAEEEREGGETYETVVQGWGKVIQVQPDIERSDWRELYFQPHLLKSLKNVIPFRLKVNLQGQLHNTVPQ